MEQERIIFVLTKNYPFADKETYLDNEIPILADKFDKVFLIPVDEYNYHKEKINPVVKRYTQVEILSLNTLTPTKGIQRFLRNTRVLASLIREVFQGRDGQNHLKNFRKSMTYGIVCYDHAYRLAGVLKQTKNRSPILYNYWFHRGTVTSVFAKLYFNSSIKTVSRAHSSDLYHRDWNTIIKLENEPFMPFEWLKIKYSDFIFPISQHGYNHFQRVFGLNSQKQSVSRLGVLDHGKQGPMNEPHVFRIVTCSGITGNKRPAFLLEVLKRLRDKQIEWVHIGNDSGEIADKLKADLVKENLADRVSFLGSMKNEAIFNFYATNQVNCFVNLSKAEGIPVSVMEALSFGIPAIVTNTVGNPEAVDESCGVIIDVELNADEITAAMLRMINDHDYYRSLRNGAFRKFKLDFDAKTNYEKLFDKMNELLDN
jgi:glycosyltransferase involved in cell wall biosynthesis